MTTTIRLLAIASLAAMGLGLGCQNQSTVQVPNRVLDRPLDLALTCVRLNDESGSGVGPFTVEPIGAGDCGSETTPACDDDGPQLIAYVANSERNEVAVLRRCDQTAAVVDLDTDTPGYQLVPVGQLPSEIEASPLGCRVVTSNAGSCDLTLLDGLGLAAIALEAELPNNVAPSSLVSRLIPIRSDGLPLGARPGALLDTPRVLSTAESTGTSSGDGGLVGGDNLCADDIDGSAWVTFPTCQLLAELDLTTGRILQSRRFVNQADGTVEVVDGGTAPDCPVDCPIQFTEGAPATCSGGEEDPEGCRPSAGLDGFFPNSLELVTPDLYDPDSDLGNADALVTYSSLFVGGTGSDVVVELPFEDTGMWSDAAATLALEDSQGITRIRAVPPLTMADGQHQFLYVIGGDGATHVVDRVFDEANVGVECDTQVDPSTTTAPFPSCNPLAPTPDGEVLAPDRRPFAAGPGIRVSAGAGFTDWAFFRVAQQDEESGQVDTTSGTPFAVPGVVGVGTTSFGRIVLSVFNQLQSASGNTTVDPLGTMDLSIPPHSLWPFEDTSNVVFESDALPAVADDEPDRALPGDIDSGQALAPSLRRIDLAYTLPPDPDDASDERLLRSAALGNPSNADGLGRFEGDAIYEEEVARVVVRDYQQWAPVQWQLEWEGNIPGTRSASGRVECETPGWEDGTCVLNRDSPTEDARLVDESAAFCDDGVLAGDKLVILGCGTDDDCGLGQRCLREPTAPASASGICISQQAFDEDFDLLRQVCAPFITDACGNVRREYLVTRAFQNELHIQALDRRLESHIRMVDPNTGLPPVDPENDDLEVVEVVDRFTCDLPVSPNQPGDGVGCTSDAECVGNDDVSYLCGSDGICRGPCSAGDPACTECEFDVDCEDFGDGALCVEGQCQRPCEPGQRDCVQALLPGPRCFSELVDYVVRTNDSFTVLGNPAPGFISERVVVDPETGECLEDTTVSELLTSRLPLARDQASVFDDPTFGIPDCPNPDEAAPSDPNPCRIVGRRSEGEDSLFHQMEFAGEPVSAIRFSTPSLSLVLDLVDLIALSGTAEVIDGNGTLYETTFPASFREFERARIPRNYAMTFDASAGYIPISEPVVVVSTVMVYPVRVLVGPTNSPQVGIGDQQTAYVVDAGGRGGPAGVRGQVIRLNTALIQDGNFVDRNFLVR